MKNSLNNPGSDVFRRNLLAAALLTAFATPGVYAATITVDPTASDAAVAGDGKCSLREAVLSINDGANVGDCVANRRYRGLWHQRHHHPAGGNVQR